LRACKASPETKAFFIQEIQCCGAAECVPALARMLGDESLAEPATRALLSIRDGVAPVLQRALADAKGRPRVGVVLALGRLADPASLPSLRDALRDPDAAVRLAAAWSLASMGDAVSVEPIFKLADGATGQDRHQATDVCFLLAETLASSGKVNDARQLLTRLRDTRQEEAEHHVRDAAYRALKSLHSSGTA
jgi:HEAT repeat protein